MSHAENPYQSPYQTFGMPVAQSEVDVRGAFIRRTYLHLLGAVLAFVALEAVIFSSGVAAGITQTMLGAPYSWLLVLVAFMIVSWVADRWASSAHSLGKQYLGLGLYVVAQAVIFVPLLYIARMMEVTRGLDIIAPAAVITAFVFVGLTAIAFITAKDFSFLRKWLLFGGLAAIALIVAAILFQFSLGVIFCWLMVVLASGYILYHTSAVMHHYHPNQHVAASLALFAAVALLFWYVLQIVMSFAGDD